MNFFEHQAQARARSTRYVLLFLLATVAVVVAVNLVVLSLVWFLVSDYDPSLTFGAWFSGNPQVFWWTTAGTAGAIAIASLYRMVSLANGGGAVARSLGGTLVDASTHDRRLRQLVNVVEEVAIAAGVPVPQVYVLENETAVNAFASGYGPSDAAITVTRGALLHLTRDELQGVIGHEFSHVFNGDMRLNTRLISVLFGILFVGLIGRLIFRVRASGRGAIPILAAGAAFIAIGYIGVLFGRMIQAAVSRSRESLADASAVQFTRNPLGLSGALKKIAVLSGALTDARSEEVSHMLIASRFASTSSVFSTHPPILDRIRAIEPSFRASELTKIARTPVMEPEESSPATPAKSAGLPFTSGIVATVGQLSDVALAAAVDRRNAIPQKLIDAAHESNEAGQLVMALVLSHDAAQRAQQMELIRAQPAFPVEKIELFAQQVAELDPVLRLPLFELSFPSLRRRTPDELRQMATLVENLCRVDGNITVFEYALGRLLRLQLYEVLAPRARRAPVVAPKLFALRAEAQSVLSVLARESTKDIRKSQAAYDQGMRRLFQMQTPPYAPSVNWPTLDRALVRLDLLAPPTKQALVEALIVTVGHDGHVTLSEVELLRTVCASLHCPLPPLASAAGTQ